MTRAPSAPVILRCQRLATSIHQVRITRDSKDAAAREAFIQIARCAENLPRRSGRSEQNVTQEFNIEASRVHYQTHDRRFVTPPGLSRLLDFRPRAAR